MVLAQLNIEKYRSSENLFLYSCIPGGLWQCGASWHPSLSAMTVLNAAAHWACLSYRLGLRDPITDAASSRVRQVQGGCADVQGSAQRCAALPWATRPCCWHTRSVRTSLCSHWPPGGPLCLFTHSRQQGVSGCHSESLEQFDGTSYLLHSFLPSAAYWKLFCLVFRFLIWSCKCFPWFVILTP